MPDTLNSVLAQHQQMLNDRMAGDVQQAQHAENWTGIFNQPNSTANLRAQRNVTDLVAQALQNKQELERQTDANAARIYEINARTKTIQDQAPLQDQVLRARLKNQESGAAYKSEMEANTQADTAGFYDDLRKISQQYPINTPEHADAVATAFGNRPHAIGNKEAVDTYLAHIGVASKASQVRDAIAQANIVNQPAEQYYSPEALLKDNPGAQFRQDAKTGGFIVTKQRDTGNDKGAAQYATPETLLAENPNASYEQDKATGGFFVKTGKPSLNKSGATLKDYGITPAQFKTRIDTGRVSLDKDHNVVGDENGQHVKVTVLDKSGKRADVIIPAEDFTAFGGNLSKPAAASTSATPEEKVMVEKEGKQYRLPKSQLADALSQGYSAVK